MYRSSLNVSVIFSNGPWKWKLITFFLPWKKYMEMMVCWLFFHIYLYIIFWRGIECNIPLIQMWLHFLPFFFSFSFSSEILSLIRLESEMKGALFRNICCIRHIYKNIIHHTWIFFVYVKKWGALLFSFSLSKETQISIIMYVCIHGPFWLWIVYIFSEWNILIVLSRIFQISIIF